MFIEQGVKPENHFWKYILGSLAIIFASFVGQIIFAAAILYDSFSSKKLYPTTNDAVMSYFDSNLTLLLVLFSFVFTMLAVYGVVHLIHKQTILSVTTSRNKVDWKRIIFSFSLWSAFTIITTLLSYFYDPTNFIFNFKPIPFAILAVIAILLVPIQTSCEEYIFRGYLMQGFANLAKNKWFPLLLTSLIFGSLHYFNPEVAKVGPIIMVYYIGTGFFLGIITLMDEGMELALGFHAANNLIGALLVTADWTALQTHSIFKDISEPSAGYEVFFPVLVIFPLLLFIFSKKYNWNNWKEKLTGKI
ncbi:CPBP family intramembrane metalloprotease [Flavobacterium sp. P4023]|uniref:CPBP family intramembrane metalloprotease n=1 Tax=Flavobacterium flabelliforme TaxID=2816119 RepID=A0ABS5CUI3_9FLAO|nr:CPBP family intramembrane glutamic endopeptidase [Flavobacterium flabelliforme]MBP4142277.1 CPBP family intramembrane metalloprotease [Flavobacterium flabelliforme]